MTKTCGDAGGRTKSGQPCRSWLNLSPVTGLCLNHDPAREAERREMHSRGGTMREAARKIEAAERAASGVPPDAVWQTLAGLVKLQGAVLAKTYNGQMDAHTADSMTRSIMSQRMNLEKRDLLVSVTALRRELRAAKQERAGGGVTSIRRRG